MDADQKFSVWTQLRSRVHQEIHFSSTVRHTLGLIVFVCLFVCWRFALRKKEKEKGYLKHAYTSECVF